MSPNKNKNSGANRRVTQNKFSDKRVMEIENSHFPRQFVSSVRFKKQIRFKCITTAGAYNVTRLDLLQLLMVNLAGTVVNTRLIAGIKLNRIEMFDSQQSQTNFGNPTSVEWLSNLGPTTLVSGTGTTFQPAHVVSSPPPQSLCSFWSLTGSNETEILMTLTVGVGCIIDCWFDIVLFDGESVVQFNTAATGTAGQLYMGYLDGPGATFLQPVSYLSLH
jgi:hypothetical protein